MRTRGGAESSSLTFSCLDTPSCGLANTRSGRQIFLDRSGFDDREEVRRRRRARTRGKRNHPANRLTYWTKSHSPARLRKVTGAGQPWVYQIMTGSRLVCAGTAISTHFVLTTAQCVQSRGEVQYLQQVGSRTFISLYRVVLHHQWSLGSDLALIQTKTPLRHFICLPTAPLHNQQLRAVQVGFKLSNLDRQSDHPRLFYQNITFPAQQSGCQGPACGGHSDLHKWVKICGKILHFCLHLLSLGRFRAVCWRQRQGSGPRLSWWEL